MKGLGTDDDTLVRIVASRCEVDMVQIKEEFQRNFKQTLYDFIVVGTSYFLCLSSFLRSPFICGVIMSVAVFLLHFYNIFWSWSPRLF